MVTRWGIRGMTSDRQVVALGRHAIATSARVVARMATGTGDQITATSSRDTPWRWSILFGNTTRSGWAIGGREEKTRRAYRGIPQGKTVGRVLGTTCDRSMRQ